MLRSSLLPRSTFTLAAIFSLLAVAIWNQPAEAQVRRGNLRRDLLGGDVQCAPPVSNRPINHHRPTYIVEHGVRKIWVPGHYEIRREQVRTRGRYERVWVPPKFRTTFCGGQRITVKVRDGFYKKVFRPGEVRYVKRRVFVPGHYEVVGKQQRRYPKHRRGHRDFVRYR